MQVHLVSGFLFLHIVFFLSVSLLMVYQINQLRHQYEFETSRFNILKDRCTWPDDGDDIGNIGQDLKDAYEEFLNKEILSLPVSKEREKRQLTAAGMFHDILRLQELVLEKHCNQSSSICVKGSKGFPGPKGYQGHPGPVGLTGEPGSKGSTGSTGLKGLPGQQGQRGPTGEKGQAGPVGKQGLQGPKGDTGIQGPVGLKGDPGIAGLVGIKGQKGGPGLEGETGEPGLKGPNGSKGSPGPRGRNGTKGDPGVEGPPGRILDEDCLCITTTPTQTTGVLHHAAILNPVSLQCLTTPIPGQTITWEKIGGEMSARYDTETDQNILFIPHVYGTDAGTYRCTATTAGGQTTHGLITLIVDGVSQNDCDFETDLCQWTQDRTGVIDWTRQTGQTSIDGPYTDHTIGTHDRGHYLYLRTSSNILGRFADLVSPHLDHTKTYCVKFWYNLIGAQVNELVLSTKTDTGNKKQVWIMTGNSGGWQSTQVTMQPQTRDYSLVFSAKQGNTNHLEIAIDDVIVEEGQC